MEIRSNFMHGNKFMTQSVKVHPDCSDLFALTLIVLLVAKYLHWNTLPFLLPYRYHYNCFS